MIIKANIVTGSFH